MERLRKIQQALKVPKSRTNEFGRFRYRSAEDILEAVKPLLGDLSLVITSQAVTQDGWHYIITTASLHGPNGNVVASSSAPAREAEIRKGMDVAQCTGASLSYSKKYALGNLFAIDDGNDPDSYDGQDPSSTRAPAEPSLPQRSPHETAGAFFPKNGNFANPAMGPEPELPPVNPVPPAKAGPPASLPAPTAQQRAILEAVSDFFRAQNTDTLEYSQRKLRDKIVSMFRSWPNTAEDGEKIKKLISFAEICVPVSR